MCGRFTLQKPAEALDELFGLELSDVGQARYNIAPAQSVWVVRDGEQNREAVRMKWGLVPPWAKDNRIGNRMTNARSETVTEKVSFKRPFRSRRCLIPADGFYEWKSMGKHKQPFYFQLADGRPFAMAGLWESWSGDQEDLQSFTILTTTANAVLKPIHHRMPVILSKGDFEDWLDPAQSDAQRLSRYLCPFEGGMQMYPVDRRVNYAANDDPRCVLPVELDQQLGLFEA